MTLHCSAILFDLDGVLVDSTAAVERAWRRWAAERQLDPDVVTAHAHGRRAIETIRVMAPQADLEKESRWVEELEIAVSDGVSVVPGAPELLQSIPADRYTIVTSATRPLAAARLRYASLSVPERFIGAGDVSQGKPHPEPYLKGAELLGFPPQECVVMEDTPAGIEAARAAGMRVIALSTTYPADELRQANIVIRSCREIRVISKDRALTLTFPGSGL